MKAAAWTTALVLALPRLAGAAPIVWAIDDGEKIKQDERPGPLASGAGNPVWSPGTPIRLFAMKNETVAFQIVVAADGEPLDGVTVDLQALASETSKLEDIVNPSRLARQRSMDICLSCHAAGKPHGEQKDYAWPVGYTPGDDLAKYWKTFHPEGRETAEFWPGGTAHKGRVQGNTFVQSVMHDSALQCGQWSVGATAACGSRVGIPARSVG